MRILTSITFGLVSFGVLAGCSSQQLYGAGQGWQRQECQKLRDVAERSRCEKSSAVSYERYQAEREAGQKPQ